MGSHFSTCYPQGEDKRWTALNAMERRVLREFGHPYPTLRDLEPVETDAHKMNTIREWSETERTPESNFEDVQNVIGSQEWTRFASRVLAAGSPVVIHSVVFPKDRDPRSMRLDSCTIREEQRTRYPAGIVPRTELTNLAMFEVFSQEDCLPMDGFRANHFLVFCADESNV